MNNNYNFFKIILLFFVLSINDCISQTIYLSSNDNKIYELNDDLSITEVASLNLPGESILDIAIGPDGVFYGVSGNQIFQIDIDANTTTLITTLPNIGENAYTSLVCSNSNDLYVINNQNLKLYKYDLTNDNLVIETTLGFSTPGDLTFYNGYLIFPNFAHVSGYNLLTSDIVNVFCLPAPISTVWGITNEFASCGDNRIIGSLADDTLVEFDLINGDSSSLGLIDEIMGQAIFGLASTTEHLASLCQGNLEEPDCNLSLEEVNRPIIKIITDLHRDFVQIETIYEIVMVEIFDLSGKSIFKSKSGENLIPTYQLTSGVYILSVSDLYNTQRFKFVKK